MLPLLTSLPVGWKWCNARRGYSCSWGRRQACYSDSSSEMRTPQNLSTPFSNTNSLPSHPPPPQKSILGNKLRCSYRAITRPQGRKDPLCFVNTPRLWLANNHRLCLCHGFIIRHPHFTAVKSSLHCRTPAPKLVGGRTQPQALVPWIFCVDNYSVS